MTAKTAKSRKIDALIDYGAAECEAAGIKFMLKKSETVGSDKRSVGFFSADSKELVVATDDEKFHWTLAHELGHLKQWQEGLFEIEAAYEEYEEWLSGRLDLDATTVISHTREIQKCELDCEKRAVKLLVQFGLLGKNSKSDYIRQANAYVFSYELHRRKKKRNRADSSPVENKAIYGLLPPRFIKDPGRIPDDYEAAVLQNCY